MRGRGAGQFRLDAVLPEGARSYVISGWRGASRESGGKFKRIPLHNTINIGVLTFPYLTVSAALNDPLAAFSYVGPAEYRGRQVHQVRVRRGIEAAKDGIIERLRTTDYFVDVETSLVLKTLDETHPVENLDEQYTQEIELESYTTIDGAAVPLVVRRKVSGQAVWELRLAEVKFNVGLTDADFADALGQDAGK